MTSTPAKAETDLSSPRGPGRLRAITLAAALALPGPASADRCDSFYEALASLMNAGTRVLQSERELAAALTADDVTNAARSDSLFARVESDLSLYQAVLQRVKEAANVLPPLPNHANARVRAARIKYQQKSVRAMKLQASLPFHAVEPTLLIHDAITEYMATLYLAACGNS